MCVVLSYNDFDQNIMVNNIIINKIKTKIPI